MLDAVLPTNAPAPGLDRSRRWVILLVCLAPTYMLNDFFFMSYSAAPEISKAALSPNATLTDSEIDWLYSASLCAVVVFTLPAAYLLHHHGYIAMLCCVCCNIAAAWLRYLSVACSSFPIAILSSVLLGMATAVIMPAFASVPAAWFSPRQQSLATAVSVQTWYAGWALGALLPLGVHDVSSMKTFMLAQAVVVSLTLPLFLALYSAVPPSLPSPLPSEMGASAAAFSSSSSSSLSPHHPALGVAASLRSLLGNVQFWVHAISYGILGGISFAIPAISANTLSDCLDPSLTYVSSQAMWLNCTFIASGVLGGLLVGALVSEAYEPHAIRSLSVVGTLALGALILIARSPLLGELGDTPRLLAVLLVLFSLAGACCLGFFSMGLRVAVRVGGPVPHVYCAGVTEVMSQLFAVGITQTSVCPVGFQAAAVCALVVSVSLLLLARYPKVAGGPIASTSSTSPLLVTPDMISNK